MLHLAILAVCIAAPARADTVDDYIARQMERLRLPGLALAVVRAGKVETVRTFGRTNLELDAPVTPTTVFELGSLTKQFTAVAMMILIADGTLRLDDSISAHLPEVPEAWRTITIRHLLTHSCGAFENRPALSENAYSAGAIVSTITDMARWAIALHDGTLIGQAVRGQIWSPLIVRRGPVPPFNSGFGWVIDQERGHRAVFHSGGTPGFSSAIRHYPVDGNRLAVSEGVRRGPWPGLAPSAPAGSSCPSEVTSRSSSRRVLEANPRGTGADCPRTRPTFV